MKTYNDLDEGPQIFIFCLAALLGFANLGLALSVYSGWWALASFPGAALWFPPFSFLMAQVRLGFLHDALEWWWDLWGANP